jgi:hypothetical protein
MHVRRTRSHLSVTKSIDRADGLIAYCDPIGRLFVTLIPRQIAWRGCDLQLFFKRKYGAGTIGFVSAKSAGDSEEFAPL